MTTHDSGLSKAAPRLLIPLGAVLLLSTHLFGCGEQVVAFPGADEVRPTVVASAPDDEAFNVALNRTLSVRFSEPMDPDTISDTNFTLLDGATPVEGTVTYVGVTATFAPDANLDPSTLYTAMVTNRATDVAGNALSEDFRWTFRTGTLLDSLRPVISFTSPDDTETDVSTNRTVVVVFSEQMDPGTFVDGTFTLRQGIASIPGEVTVVGASAFFDPDDDLQFDVEYTAQVTNEVADLAGNTLIETRTWSFTTASDVMPPRVILTGPGAGASSVRRDTVITATFSEAMDSASVIASFTVRDEGGTSVDGALSFDVPSQTLVFAPDDLLDANATYSVVVSTNAENLLGTPLASDFDWTFSTGNQALGVSPLNLGSLWSFVAVSGSGLTNSNSDGETILDGDVGIFPGNTCVGDGNPCTPLNPLISGTLFAADAGMVAARAKADLAAAYADAMSRPAGVIVNDLSGMTLAPGVYTSASTMSIAVDGTVTLDGGGDQDAVFIFQIGSSLTVNNGAEIVLINGARARNVFWVAAASTTLGSDVSFRGSVLAGASNSVGTGSVVVGRLLCSTGAITLLSNTISLPL